MIRIECPNCHQVFEEDDEAQFANIVQQVRDHELREALEQAAIASQAERKSAVDAAIATTREENSQKISEKDSEIARLQQQLSGMEKAEQARQAEMLARVQQKHAEEVSSLKADNAGLTQKLSSMREQAETDALLAVEKAKSEFTDERNKMALELADAQREIKDLNQKNEDQRRQHEEDIVRLHAEAEEAVRREREFVSRQSVKLLGESLEQHCENEYNSFRAAAFRTASFEKDTLAVADEDSRATKGDYIFRDYAEDGEEFVSIMFDMKTDSDTSKTRKKNEDHLKKLDEDRRKKGCEYAVLVSTLEPESELYNRGIVDVSHLYEKMYVVRPQFFVPIITLLRNANLRSVDLRKQLVQARSEHIDITNFENELVAFQSSFGDSVTRANKKFDEAIKGIDKAIEQLQKIRKSFEVTQKHLNAANNKADSLSIKKLTKNSPMLAERFEQ